MKPILDAARRITPGDVAGIATCWLLALALLAVPA